MWFNDIVVGVQGKGRFLQIDPYFKACAQLQYSLFASTGGKDIELLLCVFLFCFLLSIRSLIWSEKCSTASLCILKIILPIFLWFHFSPEKSIKPFPSLVVKSINTITLMSLLRAITAYLHLTQVLFDNFTVFFS